MIAATRSTLSKRDRQIAGLLFAGDLDCEQIGERVGVSGRFIRYVAAGEKRPGIRAYLDTLGREVERREGCKLVQARLTALDRLTEALDAVKDDGTPDHALRIRAAATVLRVGRDEGRRTSEQDGHVESPMESFDRLQRFLDERPQLKAKLGSGDGRFTRNRGRFAGRRNGAAGRTARDPRAGQHEDGAG